MTAGAKINSLKPEKPQKEALVANGGGDPKPPQDRDPGNPITGDLGEKEVLIHGIRENGCARVDLEEEKVEPESGELESGVVAGGGEDEDENEKAEALITAAEEKSDIFDSGSGNAGGDEGGGAETKAPAEEVEVESVVEVEEKREVVEVDKLEEESGKDAEEITMESKPAVDSQEEIEKSADDNEVKLEESQDIVVKLEENKEIVVVKADEKVKSEETSEVEEKKDVEEIPVESEAAVEAQDEIRNSADNKEVNLAESQEDSLEVERKKEIAVETEAVETQEEIESSADDSQVKVVESDQIEVLKVGNEVKYEETTEIEHSLDDSLVKLEETDNVEVKSEEAREERENSVDDRQVKLEESDDIVVSKADNELKSEEISEDVVEEARDHSIETSGVDEFRQETEVLAIESDAVELDAEQTTDDSAVEVDKKPITEILASESTASTSITIETLDVLASNTAASESMAREANEVDEKKLPELLASETAASKSVAPDTDEVEEKNLPKDVAEEEHEAMVLADRVAVPVIKDEIFSENGNAANASKVDESLEKNQIAADEVQANELLHQNGVDKVRRDQELSENGIVAEAEAETKLETGDYENGDAAVLIDEKEVELVASNGSEVGTCTDIDEPSLSGPIDEFKGSSDEVDLSTNKDNDDKPGSEGHEAIEVPPASPMENCSSLALDVERVDTQVVKPHKVWLLKVPWMHNDEQAAKKKHAQSQLAELTKARDVLNTAVREQMDNCDQCRKLLEAATAETDAAHNAVKDKRKELDTIQSMVDNLKNATSMDSIDDQIQGMEHMMEHETMPLKQEREYLNEIKRLKLRREQLSSTMGSQTNIQEAYNQKDQIDCRSKLLRKELESLKAALTLADSNKKAARDKLAVEKQCLIDLREQRKLADNRRQEAFELVRSLDKENKHHREYKDDKNTVGTLFASGDIERLISHCSNQVEKMINLWNTDDEFRKLYVESNVMSTWRRLRMFDGRIVGLGEECAMQPSREIKRLGNASWPVSNGNTSSPVSASETGQEDAGVISVSEKDFPPAPKVVQGNHAASGRKIIKAAPRETVSTVTKSNNKEESNEDAFKMEEEEKQRKAEELARIEEKLRKEKFEAELKERCRLEQRAKAKEAEERKKRQVEKAQARAELKAQKEAELREKKKAKKEKKKAAAAKAADGGAEVDNSPIDENTVLETPQEPEDNTTTVIKKPTWMPVLPKKYNKVQPLPLPLRRRSRRKMQTWMWVVLITLLVAALFFAGNYLPSAKFSLPNFGF